MPTPTRALIQFSFLALTLCIFTPAGHALGIYLAASTYTKAADFLKNGGSVETGTLNGYYFLIGLFTVFGFIVGIATGRGFYLAWKALAIK